MVTLNEKTERTMREVDGGQVLRGTGGEQVEGGFSVGQRVRSDGSSRSAEATLTPRDTTLHLLDSGTVYIYTETAGGGRGRGHLLLLQLPVLVGWPPQSAHA